MINVKKYYSRFDPLVFTADAHDVNEKNKKKMVVNLRTVIDKLFKLKRKKPIQPSTQVRVN